MSRVWYGNLTNRLEEGENFTGRGIKVGDDITMYLYSDRRCYYVTEVIDQKHIKVRPYYVCADHGKATGMGHQDWKYFKSAKEKDIYCGVPLLTDEEYVKLEENGAETWVYRYNKWMSESIIHDGVLDNPWFYSERDRKSFERNGYLKVYHDLCGRVSFGVRDYHYDWEF
jgi:hypothetical protein